MSLCFFAIAVETPDDASVLAELAAFFGELGGCVTPIEPDAYKDRWTAEPNTLYLTTFRHGSSWTVLRAGSTGLIPGLVRRLSIGLDAQTLGVDVYEVDGYRQVSACRAGQLTLLATEVGAFDPPVLTHGFDLTELLAAARGSPAFSEFFARRERIRAKYERAGLEPPAEDESEISAALLEMVTTLLLPFDLEDVVLGSTAATFQCYRVECPGLARLRQHDPAAEDMRVLWGLAGPS